MAAKAKTGSSVTVFVVAGGKKKKEKAAAGTTAQSLADLHGLNGQTFFIKINRKLAHPSTVLKEGDAVEFVGIIYGG